MTKTDKDNMRARLDRLDRLVSEIQSEVRRMRDDLTRAEGVRAPPPPPGIGKRGTRTGGRH